MSVVLLNDAIVHYEVLGRGRPVIFLHGWVGSWRYWISSMQVASTSFRAYALDLWGFGGSAQEKNRYTLDGQTKLLDAFLDEMGIGKIALVGHGWGASVALNFAIKDPSKVDRVMVTNCPIEPEKLDARLYTDSTEKLATRFSANIPDAQTALTDAKKTDQDAVLASRSNTNTSELFDKVNRQHTPCLLVSGGKDDLVGQPSPLKLGLSDFGQHIRFENAGYFPMLDSTATFNRLLTDFLALDSGLSIKELGLKEEWRRRVR